MPTVRASYVVETNHGRLIDDPGTRCIVCGYEWGFLWSPRSQYDRSVLPHPRPRKRPRIETPLPKIVYRRPICPGCRNVFADLYPPRKNRLVCPGCRTPFAYILRDEHDETLAQILWEAGEWDLLFPAISTPLGADGLPCLPYSAQIQPVAVIHPDTPGPLRAGCRV